MRRKTFIYNSFELSRLWFGAAWRVLGVQRGEESEVLGGPIALPPPTRQKRPPMRPRGTPPSSEGPPSSSYGHHKKTHVDHERLKVQEQVQEGLTDELLTLTASLKQAARHVHVHLQERDQTLDAVDAALSTSAAGMRDIHRETKKRGRSMQMGLCCQLLILLGVVVTFAATYGFIRITTLAGYRRSAYAAHPHPKQRQQIISSPTPTPLGGGFGHAAQQHPHQHPHTPASAPTPARTEEVENRTTAATTTTTTRTTPPTATVGHEEEGSHPTGDGVGGDGGARPVKRVVRRRKKGGGGGGGAEGRAVSVRAPRRTAARNASASGR